MYCKNCGAEMNANQAICLKCGVKKGTGNKFCENCGKEVNENATVCLNCGVAIKKAGLNFSSNQSSTATGNDLGDKKTVAGILAIIFGAIGLQNFYLGEMKKGIAKIVISIFTVGTISETLSIIEAVKIFQGTYEVNPDKFF